MSDNTIGLIGGGLLTIYAFVMIIYIAYNALKTEHIQSLDDDSIAPNSTVVYAGEVGIWTMDVRKCNDCGLKGHIYQQHSVCIRCAGSTKRITSIWSNGRWMDPKEDGVILDKVHT